MKQAYIQRRNVGHQNKYYTIFMKRKHSIITEWETCNGSILKQ